MAKLENDVLETFYTFLEESVRGFKKLPTKKKYHICKLAFTVDQKRNQSRYFEGYGYLHYKQLYAKFGRDFKENNLGLFNFTHKWSKVNEYTRGVKCSNRMKALKSEFFQQDPVMSELINENGQKLKTIPPAIKTEVNITNQKNTVIKARTPVNHAGANRLLKRLYDRKKLIDDPVIQELIDMVRTYKHYSYTRVGGERTLIQRYSYSDAGRLYGKGIHLQNAPKLIKQAFLSGSYDNDIDNCHFQIFQQLAAKVDVICTGISHYLANKSGVRQAIADDVGISVKQVKTALLALMYGARQTLWHDAAIPKMIGDKTPALYENPFFNKFNVEIENAREAIISNWDNTTQRSIINSMGKPISKKKNSRFIMAHIQQGIEAKILHIALELFGDNILLLQHDGFSTQNRIDTDLIITRVSEELGFNMTYTTTQNRIILPERDANNTTIISKVIPLKFNQDINIINQSSNHQHQKHY